MDDDVNEDSSDNEYDYYQFNNQSPDTNFYLINDPFSIPTFDESFIAKCIQWDIILIDSLEDAFKKDYSSKLPNNNISVLGYIYNEESIFNNVVFSNIFSSDTICQYLRDNSILWSYNLTKESSQNTFIEIWKKMFPQCVVYDFSQEKYPILVEITQQRLTSADGTIKTQFAFEALLEGFQLKDTQDEFTSERLCKKLKDFNERCDRNKTEQNENAEHKSNSNELNMKINDNAFQSFAEFFTRQCLTSTLFVMNSFEDVFIKAFHCQQIEKSRPILVYIHNDQSQYCATGLSTIFLSKDIINYLRENYIVFPCDVTQQSDQIRLTDKWKEIFPDDEVYDLSLEKCPKIIGITRRLVLSKDLCVHIEIHSELLFECSQSISIQQSLTFKTILDKLINFQEKFKKTENDIAIDFVEQTGLCQDVFIEITKYLTLNDTINAFSLKTLSLLNSYHTRIHLSDTDNEFLTMILQNLNNREISSLRLDTNYIRSNIRSISSNPPSRITSLTLYNIGYSDNLSEYIRYFVNITSLGLYFNSGSSFEYLSDIINNLDNTVKRLEIHCNESYSYKYKSWNSEEKYNSNKNIEYFIFGTNKSSSDVQFDYDSFYNPYSSMIVFQLIKIMPNIRTVRLLINKYNCETILETNSWRYVMEKCNGLISVTIKGIGINDQAERLTQEALRIQNALRQIRQTIRFRFICI